MAYNIVTVNVSTTQAPSPDTLQQSGAILSQGGTNTSPGTLTLLTQSSSLAPYLTVAKAVTSINQTAGLATVVCAANHGFTTGDTLWIVIAGSTIAGYNGTFLCTVTSAADFTYAVPSGTTSPATGTITYIPRSANELSAANTTFWAQGSNTPVYVMELGPGNTADGVAFLAAWIAANPPGQAQVVNGQVFWGIYSWLVPKYWDADPTFLAFLGTFESTTALQYFWITTTLATYTSYTLQMKCAKPLIEAPAYGAWPANALTAIAYTGAYGANVLTAISWSGTNGGTVTATTTTAHGVVPGNQFSISGCTPAGYNGTFVALAGTTGETLVYALAVNPGSETGLGTLVASTFGSVSATTTTAHGVSVGQWFQIVGCLPAGYNGWWKAITGTTGSTLVYAAPAALGSETLLGTLVQSQNASAGIVAGEFSRAAGWYVTLSYNPSTSNRVTPYNFSFIYGVTPFSTQGNSSLLATLKAANIEVVGTGYQGGLSNTITWGDTFSDGNVVQWWWGIDWANINCNLNLTNLTINGSNNPANPLYYNQDGVNSGQANVAATISAGITFGIIFGTLVQTELTAPALNAAVAAGTYNGQAVVNAIPFAAYNAVNPSAYKQGLYGGYSVQITPLRGFDSIVLNLNATQFVG